MAREVVWLVKTELLELPTHDGKRESACGALAETIVADPWLIATLGPMLAAIGAAGGDPALRARIEAAVAAYAGTRAPAAEITTALLIPGTDAATLSKLPPGAMTLGPALATTHDPLRGACARPVRSGGGGVTGWRRDEAVGAGRRDRWDK